jgi:hypothetical protein
MARTSAKMARKRRRIKAKWQRHQSGQKRKWRVKAKPLHPTGV